MSAPADSPILPWRRHALWTCLAALYAAFIFLLSEIPGSRLIQYGFRHTLANVCHVPLYGGFSVLVLMAFSGTLASVRRGPWPTLYTIAAVMTYAITDEFHQRFVPGRFASPGDLALDFLGASLAVLLLHAAARRGHAPRGGTIADRTGAASPGLLLALGIAAIAVVLYLPTLAFDFTNWDDQATVIQNVAIRSLTPAALTEQARLVTVGHWTPISTFSYALDYALWGLNPYGYHLTNVVLYALVSALLVILLLRLGAPPAAAALAGVIFVVHPAHVEVVAWITQRRELLALAFTLLSLLVYARATRDEPSSRVGVLASLALYVAAALSKPSVMIFPGVLYLYDIGFRRGSRLRLLVGKIPFVLVAVIVAIASYRNAQDVNITLQGWLGGGPLLHVATLASYIARYGRILLFPAGLSAYYDPPAAQSVVGPWSLVGYGILALAAVEAARAWPRRRRILVWMGFIWLGLLPVAQIVPSTTAMADRYLFLPSVGVAACAGAGLLRVRDRLCGPVARALWIAAVCAMVTFFAVLSWQREHVWRDPMTLWSDTVRKPPVHWATDYNYAKTLADQGDLRGAIPHYERALTKTDSILVVTNLGNAYARIGEMERAEALLRRAAALPGDRSAERAQAATNLGIVLETRGRFDAAMSAYRSAIALAPRDPVPRVLLGKRLLAMGRATDARLRFEQALERDPGNIGAEIGLADLDADAGRHVAARRRLDALIARSPNLPEARLARGELLARQGKVAEARADLDRALDLAPPGELRKRILEARDKLTGR